MAARITPRRMGDFFVLWLCSWLIAREALSVLFAFHPFKLLFWSGLIVLFLRFWLYSWKTCLIGSGGILVIVLLRGFLPAAEGEELRFRAWMSFCVDFVNWINKALNSKEMPLHERFGTALWVIFVIGAALLTVLLLDKLRLPLTAGVIFSAFFVVLQIAPFVQDRKITRLLVTLVLVMACCIWFFTGKRWDESRKKSAYMRWQAGMVLLLLPAILLTAATAGMSDMNWKSTQLSVSLNEMSERVMQMFSPRGGSSLIVENLGIIRLGGDRVERGTPRFYFALHSNWALDHPVYLRTAVFDRYTGYHWQRTLGDESYSSDEQEFYEALNPPKGTYHGADYEIKYFKYSTKRVPTPLGAYALAGSRLKDIDKAKKKAVNISDFTLIFSSDIDEKFQLYAAWDAESENGILNYRQGEILPTVPMSASAYGEVTSDKALEELQIFGKMQEAEGSYFETVKQNVWPLDSNETLNQITFSELKEQGPEMTEYMAPYLALPSGLPVEVRALAEELKLNGPYVTAQNIRTYLRASYRYTLTPDRGNGEFVSSFLFDLKEGYCTYFASAMTVLARACGIPARYVEGYAVDHAEAKLSTIVTDREMHAWSELFFPGVGWLTFDATTYSTEAAAMPIAREDLDISAYLKEQEEKEELEPEKPEQEEKEEDEPEVQEQETVENAKTVQIPQWLRNVGIIAVAAAVLYLVYRLRLLAWQRAQNRYYHDPQYIRAAFSELMRCAAVLGYGRAPTQTVNDFFNGLGSISLLENSRLQCARAARAVDLVVYGGGDPDEEDLHALADILAGAYSRLLHLRSKVWLVLWWRKGKNI